MHCNTTRKITLFNAILAFAAVATMGLVPAEDARAQSGLYAGLSAGSATIEDEIPTENLDEIFKFDEDDFAWKAFGGYKFDIPVVPLAVEFGYVDLGSPSGDFLGSSVAVDVSGWNLVGLVGVQLGPIGVFGKAGVISWDLDATVDGIQAGEDDGTDPTYGVGARFSLGSLEIRGEYELFDLDSVDDVYLLSVGLVFGF